MKASACKGGILVVASIMALAPTPAGAAPARFENFSYEGHAQERVAVGPGEFRNPVLAGYNPDPSVTRV